MPEAARLLDQVTHTSALTGLIAGAVAGAVVGAFIVATAGTGAIALGALAVGACSGASLGGMIGELAGSLFTFNTGPITAPGAVTVLIDGRPAARVTDLVACTGIPLSPIPHPGVPLAQGSTTVMIGGLPASRKGDMVGCGAQIAEGSTTVLIGGPTGTYLPIAAEVPWWLEWGLMGIGLVGGIGAIAMAGKGLRLLAAARLVGSLIGGWGTGHGGKWLGGKIFDEGSTGQKVLALLGCVGGSLLGARIAGQFVPAPRGVSANGNVFEAEPVVESEVEPVVEAEEHLREIAASATVRTRRQLLEDLQDGGLRLKGRSPDGRFAEFVDEHGTVRAKLHPPDAKTPYDHLHLYDSEGNALDSALQPVSPKSPTAHIRIREP